MEERGNESPEERKIRSKAQRLGGGTIKIVRTFGINNNQGNIVTDHLQALSIWKKIKIILLDSLHNAKIFTYLSFSRSFFFQTVISTDKG